MMKKLRLFFLNNPHLPLLLAGIGWIALGIAFAITAITLFLNLLPPL